MKNRIDKIMKNEFMVKLNTFLGMSFLGSSICWLMTWYYLGFIRAVIVAIITSIVIYKLHRDEM